MACRLPVELTDEIVGYLWNDNPALEACSLTCRAMTLASQKRLFHSVAVYPPPELLHSPYTSRNATIGTFSKFRQLLDRSPHIAEYIISLHLSDLRWSYKAEMPELECTRIGEYPGPKSLWPDDFRWLLTDTSLPSYWPLLCKLKALTIEYDGHLCSFSTLLHTFQQPSLLCIRILDSPCLIKTLNDVIGPNVKHLISLRTHHKGDSEDFRTFLSDPPSSPIYLDTLAIDYPSVFSSSLMSDPTFRLQTSRLRRLFISARSALSIEDPHLATWIILQTCSDTLEEFEFWPCRRLTVQSPEEADDDSEPIDLGKLTSLKKFTVTLPFVYTDETIFDSYRWLSKILRSANPQLGEISIHVHVLPIDTVPSSWKNMCDVLFTNFQALQRLDFVVDFPLSKEGETPMMVEAFKAFEYIERLRSRQNSNVTVKVRNDSLLPTVTSPDIRWESWDWDLW